MAAVRLPVAHLQPAAPPSPPPTHARGLRPFGRQLQPSCGRGSARTALAGARQPLQLTARTPPPLPSLNPRDQRARLTRQPGHGTEESWGGGGASGGDSASERVNTPSCERKRHTQRRVGVRSASSSTGRRRDVMTALKEDCGVWWQRPNDRLTVSDQGCRDHVPSALCAAPDLPQGRRRRSRRIAAWTVSVGVSTNRSTPRRRVLRQCGHNKPPARPRAAQTVPTNTMTRPRTSLRHTTPKRAMPPSDKLLLTSI